MKKLLLLVVLILIIPTQAKTVTACFADAYGVRRHSPDAWVSWTYQMKGHIGEKCYYPTTKDKRYGHVDQLVDRLILIQKAGGSKPPVASIPLPRPRLGTQDEIDARIDRIAATVARSVLNISLEEWVRSLF